MKNAILFPVILLALVLSTGCGKENSNTQTYSGKGILLQANPGQASSIAFLPFRIWNSVLGIPSAHAAVENFDFLKMCVGEIVYETVEGMKGASSTPLKPGLIEINPASSSSQTIGAMEIAVGTRLKNLQFTIEKVPALCSGIDYALLFKSGSEEKRITQNTAFKFEFEPSGYEVNDGQVVTLYFAKIVDAMVQLGSNLNNESVQTVNAGQAK